MEFIVENWYVIVTGIVFIVGGVMAVLRWRKRSCHLKPSANTLMTPLAK